jgi:hypothetical protein
VAGNNGWFYSLLLSFEPGLNPNGMFIPVSYDSGQTWFAYLEGVKSDGTLEDKGLLTIDNTGGPTDGNLYLSWTHYFDPIEPISIYVAASTNAATFGTPVRVSEDDPVQWSVPVVRSDGAVVVAWCAYDAIRCDISTDEGATWGADRTMAHLAPGPDYISGDIRVFSYPALAADISGGQYDGNLYCSFSNYAADGQLDLYFTVSLDGGETWSPRMRLNDDPLGNMVDQFHPWTSVNADGVITVAWYDRRLDPANLNFDLYIAHSFDGGVSWTPNQRVSNVSSVPLNAASFGKSQLQFEPPDPRIPDGLRSPQGGLIGEYIGLATSERRATMVFTDTRNGNQDVYAANAPLRLFPPRLTGPADGLITTDGNATFIWDDWSIYETALEYVLEYSEDETFTSGVTRIDGLTVRSRMVTLPEGLHYWRVRAFDTFGDSSDVITRTIWVDATAPDPPTPVPPAPLGGDTINDPTPTFAWAGSTAKAAATPTPLTYDLEIASNAGFTADVRAYPDLVTTSMVLPDIDSLIYDQNWYWRVSAEDAAGNESGFSATQEFYLELLYILGDLDDDGFITALDLGALIDVLYAGASVPVPPDARADLNCDGFPDALDLAIIIDHLFAGEPAPTCP